MNTTNTTNTNTKTNATSAGRIAPRATALAMAFTVTLLMFGGIDGLAHAPEAGSVLAAAPTGAATPATAAAAAVSAQSTRASAAPATTATAKAGGALSPRG